MILSSATATLLSERRTYFATNIQVYESGREKMIKKKALVKTDSVSAKDGGRTTGKGSLEVNLIVCFSERIWRMCGTT